MGLCLISPVSYRASYRPLVLFNVQNFGSKITTAAPPAPLPSLKSSLTKLIKCLDVDDVLDKNGYLLVSWKQLLVVLHHNCLTPGCCGLVVPEETVISEQGAAVSFTLNCTENHQNTWHSSDFYPKKSDKGKARSKLNTELSSYILLTGLQFAPTQVYSNCL